MRRGRAVAGGDTIEAERAENREEDGKERRNGGRETRKKRDENGENT